MTVGNASRPGLDYTRPLANLCLVNGSIHGMKPVRNHICAAILVGLLIGHFGMAVHASTHSAWDAGQCELCLSYHDVSGALASGAGPVDVPAPQTTAINATRSVITKRAWAPFLQRDPPVSN